MRRTHNPTSNYRTRSTIRDAYGFEVCHLDSASLTKECYAQVAEKLASVYSQHSGKWSADEKRRTDKWLQFLRDISAEDPTKKNILSVGYFDEEMAENLKKVITEYRTGEESEHGDRLNALVRHGIPSFVRGHAWSLFLNYDMEKIPGLFKLLSSHAGIGEMQDSSMKSTLRRQCSADEVFIQKNLLRTFSNSVFNSKRIEDLESSLFSDIDSNDRKKTIEQINKDLNRTFPGHPLMDDNGKSVLSEILVAFALHRPEIGYCQGMNFISGLLLLFNTPEDAFWNLVSIIENILPKQFDRDMLPAVVDKLVFKHLVQQHLPKLAAHLDELSVDVSFLCPHWFLCCFVNALPTESCLRVWDILFWERNPSVLFKVALALVQSKLKDLMQVSDAATAWEILQSLSSTFFDSQTLIQTALDSFEEVTPDRISDLRLSYQNRIKEQSIKDLLGKGSSFGVDDTSETTTPTKILAGSGRLVRGTSADSTSSTGSAALSLGSHSSIDLTSGFRSNAAQQLVKDVIDCLQDRSEVAQEDLAEKVHDLIGCLKEMEQENCQLQGKITEASLEEKRLQETNQGLKLRLGAAYAELDKKTECLDSMIAKCQILTEKVASQEETICKQRRLLANKDDLSISNRSQSLRIMNNTTRSSKSLKSLLFSGK